MASSHFSTTFWSWSARLRRTLTRIKQTFTVAQNCLITFSQRNPHNVHQRIVLLLIEAIVLNGIKSEVKKKDRMRWQFADKSVNCVAPHLPKRHQNEIDCQTLCFVVFVYIRSSKSTHFSPLVARYILSTLAFFRIYHLNHRSSSKAIDVVLNKHICASNLVFGSLLFAQCQRRDGNGNKDLFFFILFVVFSFYFCAFITWLDSYATRLLVSTLFLYSLISWSDVGYGSSLWKMSLDRNKVKSLVKAVRRRMEMGTTSENKQRKSSTELQWYTSE